MATPGARVITANGVQGILASGSPSVFDASGECAECCTPLDPCDECGYDLGSESGYQTQYDLIITGGGNIGEGTRDSCDPDSPLEFTEYYYDEFGDLEGDGVTRCYWRWQGSSEEQVTDAEIVYTPSTGTWTIAVLVYVFVSEESNSWYGGLGEGQSITCTGTGNLQINAGPIVVPEIFPQCQDINVSFDVP